MHSLRIAFTLSNVPANTDRLHRSFLRQCFEVVSHLIKTASQNAMRIRLNYSLYKSRIIGHRNISDSWSTGADSLRTSTIREHQHAMSILYKEKAAALDGSTTSSAPIVTALTHLSHEDRFALRKNSIQPLFWQKKSYLFASFQLYVS